LRVFVKNMRGEALSPCEQRKARILLKEKKAKIIIYQPFTIQMTVPTGETTQSTLLGVDLGAKHLGMAVVSEGNVLAKGEIELRQGIKGDLETRSTYRGSRRNRKTRYRKSKFEHKTKRIYSIKKKKWIKEKKSFISPRPEGWLPPSIRSRIDNTFFWIDTFASLIPNCKIHIEVGKFDVAKMIHPSIQGKEYQEGPAAGYHDVRYFVFARDSYTCQLCKKKNKILQTHHIVYRSHEGTDRASNLITLCTDCHTSENHKEGQILWKWMQEKRKTKSYKEGPFMNSFRRKVFVKYPEAHITYGSITTPKRKELELEKTHYNDAIAIANPSVINRNVEVIFVMKQFRKKKRSLHEATARKGRKEKNRTQKRNEKNTRMVKGFHLNDQVCVFGQIGFITGFSGSSTAYVKDIHDEYLTVPGKTYKQVNLSSLRLIRHNNNWQYFIQKESV